MKQHLIILSITTGILFSACSSSNLDKKKSELASLKADLKKIEQSIKTLEKEIETLDTSAKENKSKVVVVSNIAPSTFNHYIDIMGTVECEDNVLVNPKMGGLVTSVNVTEGQTVRAGQILATLENAVMQNSIDEIENQLELAKIVYEKQKRLWDQKIGTEIQYLQAKNNKEALEKRLATSKTQLSLSTIVAPFAGVVDEVNIKVGETASPGMGGIRVINMSKMKVVAKVADAYSTTIKKGDKVRVKIEDQNVQFDAVISYASLNVANNSRTFEIEINVPNSIKSLKPNSLAKISINDQTIDNALVVPLNTVQKSANGETFVMTIQTANGKTLAKTTQVNLGVSYDSQVVIKEGLSSEDQLITEGFDDLIDGQELNILNNKK
jgi:membrane fusion protein, multidrug efflux system